MLKNAVLIVLMGLLNTLNAQEISSFYFGEPIQGDSELFSIPEDFLGTYTNQADSTKQITITKDTVYYSMLMFLMTTMDQIEANNDWIIKDDLLFGIKQDEGLSFVTSGDTVLYALPIRSVGFAVENVKIAVFDNKLCVFKEQYKNKWDLTCFEKENDVLSVGYFAHEPVMDEIKSWRILSGEKNNSNGIITYCGIPTATEFVNLIENKKSFEDREEYLRSSD